MTTTLYIISGIVTLLGAFIWAYKQRKRIVRWFMHNRPLRRILGIRDLYSDRRETLKRLHSELVKSKMIRVMNLKGYSIVEEADIPDTLLHQLLAESRGEKNIEILIHFPDSPALARRADELDQGYTFANMRAEQDACIRKVQDISGRFPGKVSLRFFREPVALWSLIIWDSGILVGWYAPDSPSHKSMCLEFSANSVLGRQFIKYFEAVWAYKSVSADACQTLHPIFPSSAAYPSNMIRMEDFLAAYFGRTPSRKNAFVIMIGGGAGTGKSTLAWQLAHSFGVRNVISTDMIRQVLRDSGHAPDVLTKETWEAWRCVGDEKNAETLYAGLQAQSEMICQTLVSLAKYALSKGMCTIIEGIHILPNLDLRSLKSDSRCIVFFVDAPEDRIDKNFELRKHSTHMREIRSGFSSLEDRITLHEQMLRIAREANLPVVQGEDWNSILSQSRELVITRLLMVMGNNKSDV